MNSFQKIAAAFAVCLAACGSALATPQVVLQQGPATSSGGVIHVLVTGNPSTDALGSYQVTFSVVNGVNAVGTLNLQSTQATSNGSPLFTNPSGSQVNENDQTYYAVGDTSNLFNSDNTPVTAPLSSTPLDLFDLNYTPSSGASGTFNIQPLVTANDPLQSQLYDGSLNTIPNTSFSGTTVSVSATPEPGTATIMTLFGVVLLTRRSRRAAAR